MKKILAIVMAAMMVLSVCLSASAELAGEYDITVWAAENAVDLTKKQIEDFNATNTDGIKFNATVEPMSEQEAATQMITDVEAGPDLICFASDQFARLVQAGALAKLGAKAVEFVTANNVAGSVAAVTAGDTMYAYPMTADNGYFMYYDKSVIPEEDIDSLEKLIADCEANKKFFAFDLQGSAWYLASFFLGTGCHSVWQTADDGTFISVDDTFDSPEGLIAVKGMKKLVDSPFFLSSASVNEFNADAAVVISGTWDYEAAKGILGDNLGATDLPSFEVDGKEYHLGSFNGYKMMGVKPQVDAVKGAVLHKLAQYLTGEQGQMERFEALSWGPSNLADMASEAVQSNPALVALAAQDPYTTVLSQVHGAWWDIGKVISEDVKAATDEAGLQQALDNYQEKLASLFTLSDEVKNGWTVIGTCNLDDGFFYTDYQDEKRSNWTDDIPMVKGEDGIWKTAKAWPMEAGVEFKVRQGLSWDNAFPADNFKVEEAGTYFVTFDEATQTVGLAAE